MTTFNTILRGASFRPMEAQAAVLNLIPGKELLLVREPENVHDNNAIMVVTHDEIHIGFVAAEHAATLAPLMDEGLQFICTVDAGAGEVKKSILDHNSS